MSNRTIVEFNHDEAGAIERDPEGFVRAVLNMLRGGEYDPNLYRFGVRATPTHHHSTKAEVILTTEGGLEIYRSRFS